MKPSVRPRGLALLALLVVFPIMEAGITSPAAGATAPAKAPAVSGAPRTTAKVAATATKKTTPRRRRRIRRGPPDGVVWARHAVVIDPVSGEVLFSKQARAIVPIASLSKMMTAIVFLEQEPDLERSVAVAREDWRGAGRTQLRIGEKVRLGDLLHMSLMCSDNCATRVLARESGLDHETFIARMNRKAIELGLGHTRFVETTGLDEKNVSNAEDCARLLMAAANNETIGDIMTTRGYEFRSATRPHTVPNTNRLLYGKYEVRGGKTGFISEAGYCFATWVRTGGRDLVAVVLGAPTAATRFADVVRLVQRTTAPSFASNP
jgi:D-alanyl-D-alanine endopeptidase (penicillin-binding protein 7)